MSLLDDLAKIREMQGREPLPDPTKIQGFGPGATPAPPYIPPARDPDVPQEWLDPELDEPQTPPSPLIPQRPRATKPVPETAVPPPFSLMVMDRVAEWKGRLVQLTEPEEKSIRAVVLLAIQREVTADLAEAGAPRVRRVRRQKPIPAPESGASGAPGAVEPTKRRRGRPRGSLLRP
jgi:hypothetical protein